METPVLENGKNGDLSSGECENDEISEEMEISPELPEIEIEPCRLCDDVSDKMFNIFDDNPEGYQLIGLIKENLPIVLYKTDPLSKQVCDKCVQNLQLISSLKKQSRKTQEKYVEKLKLEGDTTDKNVLLFLGCTGSKLIDNVEDDEEEEEELKDVATSTEDLTVLCANCKSGILDASTVNGEVELAYDLQEAIRESLKKNRIAAGETDSEKVLRKRKIHPLYHELDDSSKSSSPGSAAKGYEHDEDYPSEIESEESDRPAKRRKIEKSEQEIQEEIDKELAKQKSSSENGASDDEIEKTSGSSVVNSPEPVESDEDSPEKIAEELEAERQRVEGLKQECEEICKKEHESFTFEPLTLLQSSINHINKQNIPDYEGVPYTTKSSKCSCKTCGEEFLNVKLLALHEPTHIEVKLEEKIDNPEPWPINHPHAIVRNTWLTLFDENGEDEEDEVDVESTDTPEDSELLVEDTEKTMDVGKKDEVVLVNMKPMVNGIYLGDYTKEERKAFYQCMRIGGQTKRFCPLCRYCFKDNWAIESHYFSFACHYTCRYCGMRFNKQRHRYEEHSKEHKKRKDLVSDKIYTASKVNNTMPKVIQPDKIKRIVPGEPEKPREIRLEDYTIPPVIMKGGFDQRLIRQGITQQGPSNMPTFKIKEEPKDFNGTPGKTQNQAYFCRKCYKVFFKLDEFNAHSKNCDYNCYVPARVNPNSPNAGPRAPLVKIKQELTPDGFRKSNGDINAAGRPLRNCAKDLGPYKDEVYIPKQILNETLPGPPQSFICHICGTPFPTIYSRNSHMRIHKGEAQGTPNGSPNPVVVPQNILKQRLQQQQQNHQQQQHQQNMQMQRAAMQQQQLQIQQKQMMRQKQLQQRVQMQQQQQYQQFEDIRVKEEPIDSFEPMVEIHEGHDDSPSPPPAPSTMMRELSGGAVSLTPIVKKPALNPNILKLVQNNPNISLVSKPQTKTPQRPQGEGSRSNIIKNAGGYQGPYAPGNQQREMNGSGQIVQTNYITVSPNLMPNAADDNRTYKCSSCWEAFSNKSHLYFHKKNQCEGSRFPCPFCKKRFGTEAAYSSHIFYSHPE